jgi:hypothetical protein
MADLATRIAALEAEAALRQRELDGVRLELVRQTTVIAELRELVPPKPFCAWRPRARAYTALELTVSFSPTPFTERNRHCARD